MGLLQNINIVNQYPIRCGNYIGVAGGQRSNYNRLETNLNKFTAIDWSPQSAIPNGYTHPHSWLWAKSPGGLATYKGILGQGEIDFSNLAGGKNAVAGLTGSGNISNAGLGLILSALADLTGSGNLAADIRGVLQAAADLAASGNIEGSLVAIASLVGSILASGSVEVDIFGAGNISADMVPYTTLSPQNLAIAVWDALAVDFNTAGTMGQKVNSAASAGDPWTTELPGAYVGIQAGKLIDLIKTQVDSLGGSTGGGSEYISSQLDYISSQIGFVSSNLGEGDTLNWISSQIVNVPTSSQLGTWHGEGSWQTGAGGAVTSDEIAYISTQVGFISSNLEAYGGGGGGGVKYVLPEPRKSPWTFKDKEKMVKDTHEILSIIQSIKQEIDNIKKENKSKSNELMGMINDNIDKLDKVKLSLSSLEKDKSLSDINKKINNLVDELNNIKKEGSVTKDNLGEMTDKLDQLYGIALKSLSDDDLDNLADELEK